MRRRGRGIHLIPRAGPMAAVAKPTCAAPAATGCSIASPPSKAAPLVPFRRSRSRNASGSPRRRSDVPSMFIGGKSDWGVYQTAGAAESMQKTACTRMVGFHLVDGAGHWVQQEQPGKVTELLTKFLQDQPPRDGKPLADENLRTAQ